jgi:hypothetical protein
MVPRILVLEWNIGSQNAGESNFVVPKFFRFLGPKTIFKCPDLATLEEML